MRCAWPVLLLCLVSMDWLAGCQADRSSDGGRIGGRCITNNSCPTGSHCKDGACAPDPISCKTDNDCEDDRYCDCPPAGAGCVCAPWGQGRGNDPGCAGQAFAPGAFKPPVLKCQWPAAGMPQKDVLTTPLVIDLDRDGQPEIVFHTATGIGGGGHLMALSGHDCTVKFDVTTNVTGCTQLAAGDLDGDGFPEIVVQAPGITVYDHLGHLRASTTGPGFGLCSADFPPAIANIDGQGPPEIVAGGQVSRFVAGPPARVDTLWRTGSTEGSWGVVSIPADLDGDGVMEVITGSHVYDGLTGKDKTPSIMNGKGGYPAVGGGYPAVADFNGDGFPDIVLVSSSQPMEDGTGGQVVQVIDYHNNQFIMPPTTTPMGWGGPPTVADFDGDGRPDFATASGLFYYVYSPDCLKDPRPAKCHGQDDGVLWQSPTQDTSSGSTGSSVFDFNGDGIAEVVYRDECWLRVYNGTNGQKLFAAPVTSGTDLELPVVADTDADGHADIVVSSTGVQIGFCNNARSGTELGIKHPGSTWGVKVYMDPENRWMPSRSIWNQHAYYITNINDDGSVPLKEKSNLKTFNSYRRNVQGVGSGSTGTGDATGGIVIVPDDGDCEKLWILHANLCNRGAVAFPKGVPGSFYSGDPRQGGKLICSAQTMNVLPPGQCELLSCDWMMPPQDPVELWFGADDDGQGGHPFLECKDGNDLAYFGRTACSPPIQ